MFHIIFHFLIPSISQKVGEEGRAPPWFIVLIRVSSECLGNEFVMSPIKPVISPSRAIIKSGAIKSWLAAVHVPDHTRPEHHSHLCCIDQTASLLQMSQCPLETAYSKCAGFYSTVFFFYLMFAFISHQRDSGKHNPWHQRDLQFQQPTHSHRDSGLHFFCIVTEVKVKLEDTRAGDHHERLVTAFQWEKNRETKNESGRDDTFQSI